MGMYDELDGEQVKVFYVPCFYATSITNKLGYIGGLMRYYNRGDDIEYKTWWYRYPKDFLIVDFDIYGLVNHLFHLIQNGKYMETYEDPKNISEDIFPITAVLTFGATFTLESKSELYEYLYESMVAYSKYDDILSHNKTDYDLIRKLTLMQKENPSAENKQKIEDCFKEEKERNKRIDEKRNEISRKIKTKWPVTDVTNDYGGYLDCIHRCSERDENYIEKLKEEFAEYKKTHSFEEYLNWYDPTEEEKEYMKKLNEFA